MTYRKIVSLTIALSFLIMLITGILSYFQPYSRVVATVHTTFGLVFGIGVLLHIANNFKPLQSYSKSLHILGVFSIVIILFSGAFMEAPPFNSIMDYGASLKANTKKSLDHTTYEVISMNMDSDIELTIDLLRSEHYWHPQMAVWIEDTSGQYIETLFVSKATAQGLFFGGRSKDNFKEFDQQKDNDSEYRRVDALPIWSHQRGVQYADEMYVPTTNDPLPDAITGATIIDNFVLKSTIDSILKFQLKIELNVAFDDNEYYSEYDFADDTIFHNGTGQLGQPSILFNSEIDMSDSQNYYLMKLVGHGHQSGQSGETFTDLSSLTTALDIVERIVVGVHSD